MVIHVNNFNELVEQFGSVKNTKTFTAHQIVNSIKEQVIENNIPIVVCVDYEKKNVDSGICTFQLEKYENGILFYHYTGTAK